MRRHAGSGNTAGDMPMPPGGWCAGLVASRAVGPLRAVCSAQLPPAWSQRGHTRLTGSTRVRACCLLGLVWSLFSGVGILALRTGAVLAGCSCSTPFPRCAHAHRRS